jgi:hypothetical protein
MPSRSVSAARTRASAAATRASARYVGIRIESSGGRSGIDPVVSRLQTVFLRRNGWAIAIVCAYLYVFPYFPAIQSANELPRVYLVQAIVDDHTFAIDRGVAATGKTFDVSDVNGHAYSNKAPGSSLVMVPIYAAVELVAGTPSLGTTVWLCRVFTGIIPTLLLLWLLWGFLERFAPDPAIRRLVIAAYGLGSMALTYSLLYYSHQLSAVCLASAWILAIDVAEDRRGVRQLGWVGVLAGGAILTDYQAAFAAVPIAVDVVLRLRGPRLVKALAIIAAGAALPIALLLAYHAACFGSPFRTGYDFSTEAHAHTEGFLGLSTPSFHAFADAMVGPIGVVTLSPWLLLAIPGGIVLARRDRQTAITCGAVLAVMVWFISSLRFPGGWQVGPRYIVAMLPFALPPVAAQLQAWRERRVVVGAMSGAIVAGVFVFAIATATFPYWIDWVKNPLYEISLWMVGENLFAPSIFGAGGIAAMFPFLALVAAVTGWALVRACGWRGSAVAVAVGLVLVLACAAYPRTPSRVDYLHGYVRAAVDKL